MTANDRSPVDIGSVRADAFLRLSGGPRVSVIVPAKNEAKNLPYVLPRIPAWVDEVVLVDGDSTDNTMEVAQKLRPGILIVQQDRRGKGSALRTGFRIASGDIIVTLDADGSADAAEIPAFVGALLAGADFVKGSRFLQGGETLDMEWYRRLGNWGLLTLVNVAFGGRFSDLCYGYNAFWSDVLKHMDLEAADGFEIETAMNIQALKAHLRVFEIPSKEFKRIHGKSNLQTLPDGFRVLSTVFRQRFSRAAVSSTPLPHASHRRKD
jgi:glycosyltransferase involved in cell wall biosynthesis